MSPLEQFTLIAIAHFFAVASPGPDFAIILKQSIRYNRRTAIFTSFGIATGIIVHVIYSLIGIGLLIASDERLFTVLKYIAASYFCYIAWQCFQVKKPTDEALANNKGSTTSVSQSSDANSNSDSNSNANPDKNSVAQSQTLAESTTNAPTAKKAFITGFLINALNVKATLFFVSLFSLVIVPETLLTLKIAYGVYLVLATGAWFCFISYLLTHENVRHVLQRKSYILDRVMGVVLLLLAFQLLISNIN